MKLWWVQMGLNVLWPPGLFGAHEIGWALVVIVVMLGVIVGFIVSAWRKDAVAGWLFVPYALWVAFASVLNGTIWRMN